MLGKQSGNWYWTLEIVLPIAGQPGLKIRGLAHAVARVPPSELRHAPVVANNVNVDVTDTKVEFSTPPRQHSLKRDLDSKYDDECEAKRVMYIIDSLATSPGNMFSNSPQSGNAVVPSSSASSAKPRTP